MSDIELPLDKQFNNIISSRDASIGIQMSLANAKELLEDARLLLENQRYARALALTILAVEEAGKIQPIKNILLDKQKPHLQWREVRSHRTKNFHWIFPLLKEEELNNIAIVKSFATASSDSAKYLDQMKQFSFYVEAINEDGKCVWREPSKFITAELAMFHFVEAVKVVHDNGIKWTPDALDIFVKHASIKDGEVTYDNMLAYYYSLYDGGHITIERFKKIYFNITQTDHIDS